jgi:hypothetical protein
MIRAYNAHTHTHAWQGLARPLETSMVARVPSVQSDASTENQKRNAEENKELRSSRQSTDHQDILECKTITTIFISHRILVCSKLY